MSGNFNQGFPTRRLDWRLFRERQRDHRCPFCGLDPYEYVDVGVGHVPVAVNCCSMGYSYFDGTYGQHFTVKQLFKMSRAENIVYQGILERSRGDSIKEMDDGVIPY